MTEIMLVNFFIMALLMFIQSYFYFKISIKSMSRFPIMFATTSFSLIITPLLMTYEVPTTPYIQLFFMIYQVFLFFFSSIEYRKQKKRG